ncbi:MAG: hypothetical protein AAGG11_00180 [Pseudomonadota bacterium]
MVATDLRSFEATIADFVAAHWHPPALADWQQALCAAGWTTVHWPPAQGGPGWTVEQQFVFERTLARAGASIGDRVTLDAIGPLLCALAEQPQIGPWLEAIRELRETWVWLDQDVFEGEVSRVAGELRLSGYAPWVPGLQAANYALLVLDAEASGDARLIALPLNDPAVTVRFQATLGAETEPAVATADGFDAVGALSLSDWSVPAAAVLATGARASALAAAARPRASQLTPELIGASALARLAEALAESAEWTADEQRRLDELRIEQRALDALERRLLPLASTDPTFWPLEYLRRERAIALRQRLETLALEGLGYYALPYGQLLPGSNEPPVGPAGARQTVAQALQARGLDVLDEGRFRRLDRLAAGLGLPAE